jgi:predicted O-methyltransferase YrrM
MGTDIENTLKKFSQIGLFSHNPYNGIGLWPEEQELLLTLVGESKKYLEIGSHNLGSALLVEQHAKTNGLKREVFALDLKFSPWATLNYDRAKSNLTQIQCDSNDIFNHSKDLKGVDFVFIDGYHSFNQVVHDFRATLKLMTNGGIIAFHDTSPRLNNPEHIKQCIKFAHDNFDYLTSDTTENFYVDEAICFLYDHYKKDTNIKLDLLDCSIECIIRGKQDLIAGLGAKQAHTQRSGLCW